MTDINFKDGVPQVDGSPQMQYSRKTVAVVHNDIWSEPLTITSTTDGKHSPNSKHYEKPHNAEDYRLPRLLLAYLERLRANLGNDYDIILEKDHLHVEWDPKYPMGE